MAPRRLHLLVVALLATACGSTVQGVSTVGVGGLSSPSAGGDGLGLTSPQAAGSPVGSGASVGGAGTGSLGSSSVAPLPGTPGSAVVAEVGAGPSGPGVTDTVIYVGVVHDVNAGAVNKAAGVGAITSGDTNANARAVVDDVNKHGGVAGRKVVVVTADFDSTSTQPVEQQWASVCQKFTQDQPRVFAVFETGTEAFHDCMARGGAVIISDNLAAFGDAEFRRHAGFIEQGFPSIDRLGRYMVGSLLEQKYFTPWNTVTGKPAAAGAVKVGILTYDDKWYAGAVDHYLVPALKKLGYSPIVARIGDVSTASDYGSQAAAVKSAQLSFSASGVTHVISFESNGGLSTFFLPNARSQRYYPRYGVNTASGSEALLETGVVDPAQMNGAVGFGWVPAVDLQAADYPENSPYSDAGRRHCRQVMRDHGITPDSGNAEAIELSACAGLYLLQTGLADAGRITLTTFVAALERLGSSYRAAGTLGETFGPGRHDGVSRVYHWHFVAGCGCFRYEGPLRTLP
jgi:hypothetical protein